MKFRPSTKLLDLKKKMDSLATTGNYKEAKKFKKQIKLIESRELDIFNHHRQTQINTKSQLILSREQKELKVLREKYVKQREALEMQRRQELEVMEKRYKNVMSDF